MIVDSHCHINYDLFDQDRAEMLARAQENSVQYLMNISVSFEKFDEIIAFSEQYDHIVTTIGVHPHEVDNTPNILYQTLEQYVDHPKVVGLGETGLDYYYDHSDRQKQRDSFRDHIILSQQTQLPVIVHMRDAEEDSYQILKEMMQESAFPFLIHCFSASQDFANKILDIGGYISVSGIVTFKRANALQEVIKNVPKERLLIETDAPYLAPTPHRGKRNEPSFITHTLEKIAELQHVPYEQMADITTHNYFRLFKKAKSLLMPNL